MYRLLIVDDEPIIVNGLQAFFTKRDMPDVDIMVAYSAAEAMNWLESCKIDVVLCDINMPGMSGIELLSVIEKSWPMCKVIFLTGFSEFEYAHLAVRSPCVQDYILKTEEMELIGSAVDRAIQAAKDELSVYHQKEWLQQQLPKVIHQLQRQLLLDLLRRTEPELLHGLQDEFDALKLPFCVKHPVMAMMMIVEDWGRYETAFERDLMLYAICNVAEELIGARTKIKCFQMDQIAVVGFVQLPDHPFTDAEKQAQVTAGFIHGTIESVQQVCSDLFQIALSVAVSEQFMPFQYIVQEVHRLRLVVLNGRIKGAKRLSVVKPAASEEAVNQEEYAKRLSAINALNRLQRSMVSGNGSEWTVHFEHLIRLFPEEGPQDPFNRLPIIQALSKECIVILEELGLKDQAISQANLAQMMQFNSASSWRQMLVFYQSLFEWIQRMRNDQWNTEESYLIGRIHYYIQMNLEGDLSLSRLAREVSMNPSYLSRWYKQKSGKGLSDYIQEVRIEKAKEMLHKMDYKIHEISDKIGFTDPRYFFRFFKKNVGCTPQEYRNNKAQNCNS